MQRIKKGDDVIVLAGRDKGKRGTVLTILGHGKALVDNVNIVKKHTRGNPNTGEAGGIFDKESLIDLSNIGLYNPVTKKADRVGFKVLEDGRKVRVFRSNGEVVDIT